MVGIEEGTEENCKQAKMQACPEAGWKAKIWLTGTYKLRQAVRKRGRQEKICLRGRHYARLSGKEAGRKKFGLEAGITAGCQAKRQASKNLV